MQGRRTIVRPAGSSVDVSFPRVLPSSPGLSRSPLLRGQSTAAVGRNLIPGETNCKCSVRLLSGRMKQRSMRMRCDGMLCCAMLCYAMLCYTVLRRAVLRAMWCALAMMRTGVVHVVWCGRTCDTRTPSAPPPHAHVPGRERARGTRAAGAQGETCSRLAEKQRE